MGSFILNLQELYDQRRDVQIDAILISWSGLLGEVRSLTVTPLRIMQIEQANRRGEQGDVIHLASWNP